MYTWVKINQHHHIPTGYFAWSLWLHMWYPLENILNTSLWGPVARQELQGVLQRRGIFLSKTKDSKIAIQIEIHQNQNTEFQQQNSVHNFSPGLSPLKDPQAGCRSLQLTQIGLHKAGTTWADEWFLSVDLYADYQTSSVGKLAEDKHRMFRRTRISLHTYIYIYSTHIYIYMYKYVCIQYICIITISLKILMHCIEMFRCLYLEFPPMLPGDQKRCPLLNLHRLDPALPSMRAVITPWRRMHQHREPSNFEPIFDLVVDGCDYADPPSQLVGLN